jgi:hypothetical protein
MHNFWSHTLPPQSIQHNPPTSHQNQTQQSDSIQTTSFRITRILRTLSTTLRKLHNTHYNIRYVIITGKCVSNDTIMLILQPNQMRDNILIRYIIPYEELN